MPNAYCIVNDLKTPLHDKSLGEVRDTRDIPQHNKGNLVQSQYQPKVIETQKYFHQIWNGTRMLLFME